MTDIKEYAENNLQELRKILKELCGIPAPSHFEDARAKYCKEYLESIGADGVYIDGAKNVIFPVNCDNNDKITVIEAHTDTVFPDTEPMPYYEKDGKIFSPGVGDDTECVAALLMIAKYFAENGIKPKGGMLFVCNSCEEGLGNLKGTKQIFRDFEGRIKRFVSFDACIGHIYTRCVGSARYKVTVKTEGGHSFQDFGNGNAIACLAELVGEIYKIKVPESEGSRTTYNVGTISGGTSVNTIAQEASMLCEYRSDNVRHLEIMKEKFESIFENAKSRKADVSVKTVGERPCANIDLSLQDEFADFCADVLERAAGTAPERTTASTDCNIPLSLGIPAVCIGTHIGDGAHTREEWIYADSIKPGLVSALSLALALAETDLTVK